MDCLKELLANPLLSILVLVFVFMMFKNKGVTNFRNTPTLSDASTSSGIFSTLSSCVNQEFILVVVACVIILGLFNKRQVENFVSNFTKNNIEHMESNGVAASEPVEASDPASNAAPLEHQAAEVVQDSLKNEEEVNEDLQGHLSNQFKQADNITGGANMAVAGNAGRAANGDWTSEELLPEKRQDYPHVPGNYVVASHHFGVDTIGQSLRNANYQIRSDPPIKRDKFNPPWGMSTMDGEQRRPLEIGCECP